jgi:diguanylate cyclase (GGDEF)-like protein
VAVSVPTGRSDRVRRWAHDVLGDRAQVKTLALTGALIAVAGLLLLRTNPDVPELSGQLRLTWWQLAVLFAAAEVVFFQVEVRSESHAFTLTEVPLLLGLMFASPVALVAARLLGGGLVLVGYERQKSLKLVLNLAVYLAETALALTAFRLMTGRRSVLDPSSWAAGTIAVVVAGVFSASVVWMVIRWHGGMSAIRPTLLLGVVTTIGNASLAIVASVLVAEEMWTLPAVVVILAVVFGAYREYGRITRRYAALELLFRFTRMTGDAVRPTAAIERVLDQATDLLRAQSAWITLTGVGGAPEAVGGSVGPGAGPLPEYLSERLAVGRDTVVAARGTRDPHLRDCLTGLRVRDLMAAPLLSGGGETLGAIVVANRLGPFSSFDAEDARLFTALAAQAGIALENGRLVQRLHEDAEAREHEALHDALTGLPNRALFSRQLTSAFDRTAPDARCAVLLMDLDQFKEVNDTLGHHTGDRLLQEVGERLHRRVGDRGLVSRLGGDEFAVLLTELSGTDEAIQLAHEVFHAVTQPVQLSTVTLAVGASIGVAVQPEHGHDPTTLLQRADIAMYTAKRGQDPVALYDPGNDWNSELRLRLAGEISGALEARDFQVHYQPIVHARDGHVAMVEALARWQHPELGELSPDQFIPIAERTGMIHPLTLYVLDSALDQCHRWQGAGLDVRVAVNLSIQVMLDTEWPERVLGLLAHHRVDPDRLVLEITETTIMSDPARTVPAMRRLTDVGVQVGIDDFGTGYSSLSYLQRLPVTEIKIDKSFVAPMVGDPTRRSIIRSVVELAHSLDMSAVAEGVEDQCTLDYLVEIGCDLVQGHWLSRPLPAGELTAGLAHRFPREAPERDPETLRSGEAAHNGNGAVDRSRVVRLPTRESTVR